ncbi:alpha/beta hydrolase [Klebsiella pneumoniae]|nr:alpha/beta hydrolase [Klebsiella pneumoniae]
MESVIIPVSQGGFVAATLWQRHKAKALVIVHPATAVVQGFYKGFAEYLYKRGFSVITYDYRGTGLSKSGRVRHNKNTMSDWIEQDVGCITAWAKARAPGLTLLAIGHSIGGHAVLLSSASTDLRAAVMVASHAGVTSTISQTKEKLRVWCLLRVLGPALCGSLGICQPDVSGWVKIYRLRRCFSGDAGARCLNISMTTRSGMRVSGQER